ncbi:acid protease [Zopfia rhizophila CBS 207.26]|uniref:Acid protease n=1 Tax=Zopfia rhizophila CBS 207.26 TaxID=1314779 RepID=A0A6A6E7M9_9PEZI|nr:acid protease [Zopfia rhizophila CBS 207.26]
MGNFGNLTQREGVLQGRTPLPLLLPWTNATVSADGTILSRGIEFTVGTPPQPFALTPATSTNNLYLNNVAECVAAKNSSCIGQVGGAFDNAASTTFAQSPYAVWRGSRDSIELASSSSYAFFEDAISFGLDPATNKDTAFPMYTNGSTDTVVIDFDTEPRTKATLPLGPNSTFLNFLVDSGQASSRTYGLWVGSESEEASQDGLLVVGGYDTSRVKSAASTFPMYSDCPTCAIVTAITYDLAGKSNSLFDNTTETLMVSLDPFTSTLELPDNMLENLAAADKSAMWDGTLRRFTFDAATAPTATFTITLSDANTPLGDGSKQSVATYKTTIPATELFRRPRAYDATGKLEITNNTIYELEVTNRTGSNIATFGLPFFTQNYLIFDAENQNFQLAPAVLTPIDPKKATVTTICRPSPPMKTKLTVGALAGAVIGTAIGVLAIVFFLILWFRRRKRQNQHRDKPAAAVASLYERMEPNHTSKGSEESTSIQLRLQQPAPTALRASPSERRSNMSMLNDPRRDLDHWIYEHIDRKNDGRLLDERPTGLHETIHSKGTLPRVASGHHF